MCALLLQMFTHAHTTLILLYLYHTCTCICTPACTQRHRHATHKKAKAKSKVFWLLLNSHTYPLGHLSATQVLWISAGKSSWAGLVTRRKLYHASQIRVWAPEVPPGSLPTMQDMDSCLLLHNTHTHPHAHTHAHKHRCHTTALPWAVFNTKFFQWFTHVTMKRLHKFDDYISFFSWEFG